MSAKVRCFFADAPDGQIAYDVRITDPSATVADYLQEQAAFAAQYLADCKGCDGCCYERAPLTVMDVPALATLVPGELYPAHRAIAAYGHIEQCADGAIDIMLRRPQEQACCLLDQEQKCCTAHQARPFVCRSHFCIGKSAIANQLRSYLANLGLDALILQLYAEEQAGAPRLLPPLDPEDYQHTPLAGINSYQDAVLKDCLPEDFWQQIWRS